MAALPLEHRRYAAVLIADDHSDIHAADVSWWLCRAGVTGSARLAELLPIPSVYAHDAGQHASIVRSEIEATRHDAFRAAARWLTRMQLAATSRHVTDLPTESEFPAGTLPQRPGWLHVEPLIVRAWRAHIRMAETLDGHSRRMTASTTRICHGRSAAAATACTVCGQINYPLRASEPINEAQTAVEAAVRAAWRVSRAVDRLPYPTCWDMPPWRAGGGPAADGETAADPTTGSSTTHHSSEAR